MSLRAVALILISFTLTLQPTLRADAPPAADPSDAPTIDPLPAGWTHKDDTLKKHQGENAEAKAYFEVTAAEKAIPFQAWCKKMAAKEDKDSPIVDPKITDLKPGKIGDYEVMTYETTGTVFLSPVHTRMYFVVLPTQYARLLCTGVGENWNKVEGQLDELVKHMK